MCTILYITITLDVPVCSLFLFATNSFAFDCQRKLRDLVGSGNELILYLIFLINTFKYEYIFLYSCEKESLALISNSLSTSCTN